MRPVYEKFEDFNLNEGRKKKEKGPDFWTIFKTSFLDSDKKVTETHYGKKKNIDDEQDYLDWLRSNAKTQQGNPLGETTMYKLVRSHPGEKTKVEKVFSSEDEDEANKKIKELAKEDGLSINSLGMLGTKKKERGEVKKVTIPRGELWLPKGKESKEIFVKVAYAKENKELANRVESGSSMTDHKGVKYVKIKNKNNIYVLETPEQLKASPSSTPARSGDKEMEITPGTTIEDIRKFFGLS